jgi:hypothetical protein
MDGQRFDDLTKALVTTSRRRLLKALAGAAGGVLSLASATETNAAWRGIDWCRLLRLAGRSCRSDLLGRARDSAVQAVPAEQPIPEICNDCDPRIPCLEGEISCEGACFDPSSDPVHCGACYRSCPAGGWCEGGVCVCPSGQTNCGSYCTDLSTDWSNCGACGNVCPSGILESGGGCYDGVCACPSGTADCGRGYCEDFFYSWANRGACGNSCDLNADCIDGTCVCREGYRQCGGRCVYVWTDNNNCGRCGNVCGPGRVCCGGRCIRTLLGHC